VCTSIVKSAERFGAIMLGGRRRVKDDRNLEWDNNNRLPTLIERFLNLSFIQYYGDGDETRLPVSPAAESTR
jgi:hypothetical protein